MSDAKAIRKHTAQHDLFNRLHSIAADEAFVRTVASEWFENRFEVVPNQRCGTWYCDPSTSSKAYAYFKSTDGHTNNWNFNLRRSNLPFAKHAEARGGLILVDSTRRGKRMPDALSKTVPIWCAVINLAIELRRQRTEVDRPEDWDTSLYLPPNIVSPSEKSQIEALLPTWAEALETSALPLPDLAKPLRPFFIHPSTSLPPHIPTSPPYTPVICSSSSRWVGAEGDEIPRATKIGSRTVGFEYVPGAGDDDELWARGLRPSAYHASRAELLSADRDGLPDLVDRIVESHDGLSLLDLSISGGAAGSSGGIPQRGNLAGLPTERSALAVGLGPPTTSTPAWTRKSEKCSTFFIVEVEKVPKEADWIVPFGKSGDYVVALPNPKSDGWAWSKLLKRLIQEVEKLSDNGQAIILHPARTTDFDRARQRQSEQADPAISTDASPLSPAELVSARKAMIPVTVTLLCAVPELDPENLDFDNVDKGVIAAQLHRLVARWPDGNPPRAALKRMNEVLMSGEWTGT